MKRKAHLPHSDACYVRAYPAATAEAWIDGHVHAFAFFGGVPQWFSTTTTAVCAHSGGQRRRARLFASCRISKAAETQRMSHRGFQSLCHIRVRTVQLPPTSL